MNNNSINTPTEAIEANINGGVVKANLPLGKMILLGILAGAFIAIGGASSNVAVHSLGDVGLARTLAGVIFPVGLMMIVLVGGELFTGNCLLIMGVLDKKVTWLQMVRNLGIVYLSNLVGSLIIDVLVFYSGQYDYTGGLLGAYTIKVALAKATISPLKGFTSGIMCNILVCVAILAAAAAKDAAGKIWAIFFPILAFVASGYEHCVANMYYIPAGMLAASNPAYVTKAEEVYGITAGQCEALSIGGLFQNLIPVTLGNIVGGSLFLGVLCFCIYRINWAKKAK
ncbi:MAG: formate/nitrite transporter family protein [Lachnospiraceae bacterium]|nr:formate/nitrite transporter family protein [Lachnospiraceae bacterium]